MVATGGAPEVRLTGRPLARAGELGVDGVAVSLTRTETTAGAVRWLSARRNEACPGWLEPLYEAGEMRAVDAWAIEDRECRRST